MTGQVAGMAPERAEQLRNLFQMELEKVAAYLHENKADYYAKRREQKKQDYADMIMATEGRAVRKRPSLDNMTSEERVDRRRAQYRNSKRKTRAAAKAAAMPIQGVNFAGRRPSKSLHTN